MIPFRGPLLVRKMSCPWSWILQWRSICSHTCEGLAKGTWGQEVIATAANGMHHQVWNHSILTLNIWNSWFKIEMFIHCSWWWLILWFELLPCQARYLHRVIQVPGLNHHHSRQLSSIWFPIHAKSQLWVHLHKTQECSKWHGKQFRRCWWWPTSQHRWVCPIF